jgi:hypothetical protein
VIDLKGCCVALLPLLLLAGCATNQKSADTHVNLVVTGVAQQGMLLPIDISEKLTANNADVALTVNQSWAQTVEAEPSYFAASGRWCRRLTIVTSAQANAFTSCQLSNSQWLLASLSL